MNGSFKPWFSISAPFPAFDSLRKAGSLYDSGKLTIHGDTLKLIRYLAKLLDSNIRRLYDVQACVDNIITAANGATVTARQLKRWNAAVRRYDEFVYGKRDKKLVKHSK